MSENLDLAGDAMGRIAGAWQAAGKTLFSSGERELPPMPEHEFEPLIDGIPQSWEELWANVPAETPPGKRLEVGEKYMAAKWAAMPEQVRNDPAVIAHYQDWTRRSWDEQLAPLHKRGRQSVVEMFGALGAHPDAETLTENPSVRNMAASGVRYFAWRDQARATQALEESASIDEELRLMEDASGQYREELQQRWTEEDRRTALMAGDSLSPTFQFRQVNDESLAQHRDSLLKRKEELREVPELATAEAFEKEARAQALQIKTQAMERLMRSSNPGEFWVRSGENSMQRLGGLADLILEAGAESAAPMAVTAGGTIAGGTVGGLMGGGGGAITGMAAGAGASAYHVEYIARLTDELMRAAHGKYGEATKETVIKILQNDEDRQKAQNNAKAGAKAVALTEAGAAAISGGISRALMGGSAIGRTAVGNMGRFATSAVAEQFIGAGAGGMGEFWALIEQGRDPLSEEGMREVFLETVAEFVGVPAATLTTVTESARSVQQLSEARQQMGQNFANQAVERAFPSSPPTEGTGTIDPEGIGPAEPAAVPGDLEEARAQIAQETAQILAQPGISEQEASAQADERARQILAGVHHQRALSPLVRQVETAAGLPESGKLDSLRAAAEESPAKVAQAVNQTLDQTQDRSSRWLLANETAALPGFQPLGSPNTVSEFDPPSHVAQPEAIQETGGADPLSGFSAVRVVIPGIQAADGTIIRPAEVRPVPLPTDNNPSATPGEIQAAREAAQAFSQLSLGEYLALQDQAVDALVPTIQTAYQERGEEAFFDVRPYEVTLSQIAEERNLSPDYVEQMIRDAGEDPAKVSPDQLAVRGTNFRPSPTEATIEVFGSDRPSLKAVHEAIEDQFKTQLADGRLSQDTVDQWESELRQLPGFANYEGNQRELIAEASEAWLAGRLNDETIPQTLLRWLRTFLAAFADALLLRRSRDLETGLRSGKVSGSLETFFRESLGLTKKADQENAAETSAADSYLETTFSIKPYNQAIENEPLEKAIQKGFDAVKPTAAPIKARAQKAKQPLPQSYYEAQKVDEAVDYQLGHAKQVLGSREEVVLGSAYNDLDAAQLEEFLAGTRPLTELGNLEQRLFNEQSGEPRHRARVMIQLARKIQAGRKVYDAQGAALSQQSSAPDLSTPSKARKALQDAKSPQEAAQIVQRLNRKLKKPEFLRFARDFGVRGAATKKAAAQGLMDIVQNPDLAMLTPKHGVNRLRDATPQTIDQVLREIDRAYTKPNLIQIAKGLGLSPKASDTKGSILQQIRALGRYQETAPEFQRRVDADPLLQQQQPAEETPEASAPTLPDAETLEAVSRSSSQGVKNALKNAGVNPAEPITPEQYAALGQELAMWLDQAAESRPAEVPMIQDAMRALGFQEIAAPGQAIEFDAVRHQPFDLQAERPLAEEASPAPVTQFLPGDAAIVTEPGWSMPDGTVLRKARVATEGTPEARKAQVEGSREKLQGPTFSLAPRETQRQMDRFAVAVKQAQAPFKIEESAYLQAIVQPGMEGLLPGDAAVIELPNGRRAEAVVIRQEMQESPLGDTRKPRRTIFGREKPNPPLPVLVAYVPSEIRKERFRSPNKEYWDGLLKEIRQARIAKLTRMLADDRYSTGQIIAAADQMIADDPQLEMHFNLALTKILSPAFRTVPDLQDLLSGPGPIQAIKPDQRGPMEEGGETAPTFSLRRLDPAGVLSEFYLNGPEARQQAISRFGSAQALLRGAAQSLAESAQGDPGTSQGSGGYGRSLEEESRRLKQFAQDAGLLFDPAAMSEFMRQNTVRSGAEHTVALHVPTQRAIKTMPALLPATENLYDYLTDHLLSNYLFDDDIQLEGFYELDSKLVMVFSQPWVQGEHPDWTVIVDAMTSRGMIVEGSPRGGTYSINDPQLGTLGRPIDLKPDNVIQSPDGAIHPIDAHFYFDSFEERQEAVRRLPEEEPPSLDGPTFSLAGPKARGFAQAQRKGQVFRGLDGVSRFEIHTGDARLIPNPKAEEEPVPLDKFLRFPELYRNYPDLRDVAVVVTDLPERYDAQFDATNNTIRLSRDLPRASRRSRLLHEIQHWIQVNERFASQGSNLETATGVHDAEVASLGADPSLMDPDIRERGIWDAYRRNYGEAEARLVESRRNLSRAERAARHPYSDLDVAESDVTFSLYRRTDGRAGGSGLRSTTVGAGLSLPVMVQFLHSLGVNPTVNPRLRTALGRFTDQNPNAPSVQLRPGLLRDPDLALEVLAHEIGHFLDALHAPGHGNMASRIAPLGMSNWAAVIPSLGGASPNTILRNQAIALSEAWRGPIAPGDSYRNSSRELYADFISVLFNNAPMAQQMAPDLYRAFFATLNQKPELRQAWNDLQILTDPVILHNHLLDRLEEGYHQGIEALRRAGDERRNARNRRHWLQKFRQDYLDRWAPIAQREGSFFGWRPADSFTDRLQVNEGYAARTRALFNDSLQTDVMGILRTAGVGEPDFHQYLILNRIIHERTATSQWIEQNPADARGFLAWLADTANASDFLKDQVANVPDADLYRIGAQLAREIEDAGHFNRDQLEALETAAINDGTLPANVAGRSAQFLSAFNVRGFMLNTEGIDPEAAQGMLDQLQARVGATRYHAIEQAAENLHNLVRPIVETAIDLGIYSEAIANEVLRPNMDVYVPFQVLDYFSGEVSAALRRQYGTTRMLNDALTATSLYAQSLMGWIQRQQTALMLEEWANLYHVGMEDLGPQTRHSRPRIDRDQGQVMIWRDGTPHILQFEEPEIAQSANYFEELTFITALAREAGGLFSRLFTTYSPGFLLWTNALRDLKTGMERFGVRNLFNAAVSFRHAVDYARSVTFGRPMTPLIRTMVEEGSLPAPSQSFGRVLTETEFRDSLNAGLSARDVAAGRVQVQDRRGPIRTLVRWLDTGFIFTSGFFESLPKMAASRSLTSRGAPDADRIKLTRIGAGIPNPGIGGLRMGSANGWMLFFRVITQGMRAERDFLTNPRTRGGYMLRLGVTTILPKVMQYLAATGLLGTILAAFGLRDPEDEDELKVFYRKLSPYKKEMGDVIPLGWITPEGFEPLWGHKPGEIESNWQAFGLRIPASEGGRLYGSLTWNLLTEGHDIVTDAPPEDMVGTGDPFRTMARWGLAHIPGLNPAIETAGQNLAVAQGVNPVDSYYNRPIINYTDWNAGGWHRVKALLKHNAQQLTRAYWAPVPAEDITGLSEEQQGLRQIAPLRSLFTFDNFDQSRLVRLEEEEQARLNALTRKALGENATALMSLGARLERIPAERRTREQEAKYQLWLEFNRRMWEGKYGLRPLLLDAIERKDKAQVQEITELLDAEAERYRGFTEGVK